MSWIAPDMWSDRDFLGLPARAQILWAYLLQGPEAIEGCPGLYRHTAITLADVFSIDVAEVRAALGQLEALNWIELDTATRTLRIPRAPGYRTPNENIVRGWYRRWVTFPDSDLKQAHVSSMRAAVNGRAWGAKVWAETFGNKGDKRGKGFANGSRMVPAPTSGTHPIILESFENDKTIEREREISDSVNGSSEGFTNDSERVREPLQLLSPLSPSQILDPRSSSEGEAEQLAEPLRNPDSKKRTSSRTPPTWAEEFWAGFTGLWQQAMGAKPTWPPGGLRSAARVETLQSLLEQHGTDEVLRRAAIQLFNPPKWPKGNDVGTLVDHFDAFATGGDPGKVTGHERYDGVEEAF